MLQNGHQASSYMSLAPPYIQPMCYLVCAYALERQHRKLPETDRASTLTFMLSGRPLLSH